MLPENGYIIQILDFSFSVKNLIIIFLIVSLLLILLLITIFLVNYKKQKNNIIEAKKEIEKSKNKDNIEKFEKEIKRLFENKDADN